MRHFHQRAGRLLLAPAAALLFLIAGSGQYAQAGGKAQSPAQQRAVASGKSPVAVVLELAGTPKIRRSGAATSVIDVEKGAGLFPGDVVEAPANSTVKLAFNGGSILQLRGESAIDIFAPGAVVRGRKTILCGLRNGKIDPQRDVRLRANDGILTPRGIIALSK